MAEARSMAAGMAPLVSRKTRSRRISAGWRQVTAISVCHIGSGRCVRCRLPGGVERARSRPPRQPNVHDGVPLGPCPDRMAADGPVRVVFAAGLAKRRAADPDLSHSYALSASGSARRSVERTPDRGCCCATNRLRAQHVRHHPVMGAENAPISGYGRRATSP